MTRSTLLTRVIYRCLITGQKKYGDGSPECVDLYFAYGKALLENAIAQNSVLGKEETGAGLDDDDEDNKGMRRVLSALNFFVALTLRPSSFRIK